MRVVHVFVIDIELNVCGYGQKATRKESCGVPFGDLALITELCSDVRIRMIGADGQAALQGDTIAVGPTGTGSQPIDVKAVSVRDNSSAGKRNMQLDDRL